MHFFLPLKAKMYSTCPRTRNYSTPHVLPLRTGFVVSALQNLTSFEVENSLPAFVRGQQIGAACLHANQKKQKKHGEKLAKRTNMQRNENSSATATKTKSAGKLLEKF